MKYAIDKRIDECPFMIDTVINNFGINHLSWIGSTPDGDEAIMRINTMGPYWVINKLVQIGNPCQVVNISSQTYRIPQRCTTLYCASKAALVQMTKVMARELAPQGWVINAFAPGKIFGTKMSEMTDDQVLALRGWSIEEADKYSLSNIPMERFTSINEAADIVKSILGIPAYVNGACIDATGGV